MPLYFIAKSVDRMKGVSSIERNYVDNSFESFSNAKKALSTVIDASGRDAEECTKAITELNLRMITTIT